MLSRRIGSGGYKGSENISERREITAGLPSDPDAAVPLDIFGASAPLTGADHPESWHSGDSNRGLLTRQPGQGFVPGIVLKPS